MVINGCFGGFSLSDKACLELKKLNCGHEVEWPRKGGFLRDVNYTHDSSSERACPALVQVVERLKASGGLAELVVIEVPDDVKWHIEEYDGNEWVAEDHRTWGK